ncbi:MAG TPA: hypothetical protein VHA52_06550 [Candidatus Babeliaceae bacterium]|nr:hypothetical protein [Candidatus Babeliaceae bacterium]
MSTSTASAVASGSSSLYAIDKLNSSNFSAWKFRMQMILIDRGLWEMVDGSQVEPVSSDTAESRLKYAEWKKKDNTALAQIALTVSTNELAHIKGVKSAREAWLKICNVFEAKGLDANVFLRRKFFNTKFNPNDSMQAHINYVRELAEKLDAIGDPVRDKDIAMTLLSSLPEDYDPLIVALQTRPEDLTSEFVANRLLAEERRRQESHDSKAANSGESAFVGRVNGFNSSANKRNMQRCTYCRRPGHSEDKCYKKHGYPVGHPLHNKAHIAAVAKVDSVPDPDVDTEFAAFTMNVDGEFGKNDWFLDSGASVHLSGNRDWFQDFKAIPGVSIHIGDGRVLNATGYGNIPVKVPLGSKVIRGMIHRVLYVADAAVNLLSVSKMTDSGLVVTFSGEVATICDKSGKTLALAVKEAGSRLYRLSFQVASGNVAGGYLTYSNASSVAKLWHERLGHLNYDSMRLLKLIIWLKTSPIIVRLKSIRIWFKNVKVVSKASLIVPLFHLKVLIVLV